MRQLNHITFGNAAQRGFDLGQYTIDIQKDGVIPKPENAIAFAFEPAGTRFITRGMSLFAVLPTINLDNKARRHAGKIRNVRPNDNLPPKMTADHRVMS